MWQLRCAAAHFCFQKSKILAETKVQFSAQVGHRPPFSFHHGGAYRQQ
jgi:hypothetical protein